jgi:hypothetical protein
MTPKLSTFGQEGTTPSERYHQRLARLAAPLQPEEAPYYVNSFRPGHPGYGWYWRPTGIEHPAWLGVNHIQAETTLLELRQRAAAA